MLVHSISNPGRFFALPLVERNMYWDRKQAGMFNTKIVQKPETKRTFRRNSMKTQTLRFRI